MRNLNSVPLSALRTVEAIARTGTLENAADELGVTAGALSQRLANAEKALGRSLFMRTSVGLKANQTCIAILPRLSRALSDLSAVVADISDNDTTVLTVSVAPIFASRWLIWRISRFNEQNPTIQIRLEPRAEVIDLNRSEVDVGIRIGATLNIDEYMTKLLDQRVFPVCSPDIAKSISKPEDLLNFPIIHENDQFYGWDVWLSETRMTHPAFRHGPTYGDASLCLDAAMTGQGVFMAWETLACDALERGQVCAPFQQRSKTGAAYWFAVNKFAEHKPNVKKFRSWLQCELDDSIRGWRNSNKQ